VTWDRLLTPSCWHGVTSVVIGNCGFALAPCRPQDRERLLRMLEHVEGMPYESLAAGVTWTWESITEYFEMLRAEPLGLNVGVLLGHSTIRSYVLGAEAYDREATADEVARMQALVREGMAAGALGLGTSFSPGHVGEGGRPVPSRAASRDELRALACAMGGGVLEITPETFPIEQDELSWLQDLSRETGCTVSFSAVLDLPDRPGVWEPVFERIREGNAAGTRVVAQVSCRPMRFDFDLPSGCASLDAAPCWKRFRGAGDRGAQRALLADAGFREAFRRETIGRPDAPSSRRWATVTLEETPNAPDRRFVGRVLGDIARERGGDVVDALFDLAADSELNARFSMLLLNYDEDRVGELLRQPESLIALSDAGAHASILCDAGYATHLLGHWVRERGLFSVEEAVRRLTSMPAEVYGIGGRGRLVEGAVADVTCFDAGRVAMRAAERVRDLPGGAERWTTWGDGVVYVLIAGESFLAHGNWTGRRPGRVLVRCGSTRQLTTAGRAAPSLVPQRPRE
jgi:N-acyl-D-aspartate/D-glutamate deacylase